MSRFELTAAYATCFVGATVLYDWGRASHPDARTVGTLLGLFAVSLLFTVVTWSKVGVTAGFCALVERMHQKLLPPLLPPMKR